MSDLFELKKDFLKNSVYLHLKKNNFIRVFKNLYGLFKLKISEILKLNFDREVYKMIFHLEMEPNINNKIYYKKIKL